MLLFAQFHVTSKTSRVCQSKGKQGVPLCTGNPEVPYVPRIQSFAFNHARIEGFALPILRRR